MLAKLDPLNWLPEPLSERLDALGDWLPRCLPRRLQRWLAARHPRLVAGVTGDGIELVRVIGATRETRDYLPLQAPAAELAERAAKRRGKDDAAVTLELPAALVLRRELRLPAQVKSRLRAAIGYELDRLTPFTVDEVYYDARVLGTQGAQLRLELALCRRAQALPYLERLRAAGIRVARLSWRAGWPRANLLPLAERPTPKRLGVIISLALGLLALALLVALLATPLWQRQYERAQLDEQLEQLRSEAETVAALREELEQAQASNLNVLKRSREAPRMSDLLRELTDRLSDSTWIQTLNYRDGTVDMRGQSSQATALIALLEQGPGISAVSFRSPVMQIASDNTERFHIAFDYQRPEPQ